MISVLKYERDDYKMCSNWRHDKIRELPKVHDDAKIV